MDTVHFQNEIADIMNYLVAGQSMEFSNNISGAKNNAQLACQKAISLVPQLLDAKLDNAAGFLSTIETEPCDFAEDQDYSSWDRWIDLTGKAANDIAASSSLDPATSRANAAPLEAEIEQLRRDFVREMGEIGGRGSIKGALFASGAKAIKPLQERFVKLLRSIENASLLRQDRERLLELLRGRVRADGSIDKTGSVLGSAQKAAAKAGVEGQKVAKWLTQLEECAKKGTYIGCILKLKLGKFYYLFIIIGTLIVAGMLYTYTIKPFVS